jgi:protein-tyrosine phosphatase
VTEPYWVKSGRLLAGGYPRSLDRLVEAGVTLIVDLTEEGELPAYDAAGMRTARVPVADFSCPPRGTMTEIIDLIDAELAADGVVYVHCHGGTGRTGTVVGCWLVRHGLAPADALARLPAPPETPEQRALVMSWR